MKKLVDTLGAALTFLCLCIMPVRADALGGGILIVGLGVIVLIVAILAVACSLLIRAVQKRKENKEDDEK